MRINYFDALYQYFTKNSKCSNMNHFGIPIYYCSNNLCDKGYICSQCLTEDPDHFTNHVKYFLYLDTKKNFFRFLEIPIDNNEESFTNNFKLNSRNKFLSFNKEKIYDVGSFYDYIKCQIAITINNNQKNNLIKDENIIGEYYNKKKGIKTKNNEYINNSIKEFIKNDDKHQIINLINKIKPSLNQKSNEIKEKDKLNEINNILEEEIPKIIDKCMNILCHMDEINNIENDNEKEKEIDEKKEINGKKEEINKLKDNNDEKEKEKGDLNKNENNFENNKIKTNKIINIINDIKPIKNDIKILNIEFKNSQNFNNFNDLNSFKNTSDNHKSFYEGSINNISTIKAESNLEAEEFESKININLNMNNIEINKQKINISPPKDNNNKNNNNKHPSVNDPFFKNKELNILEKETEKKGANKIQFNNYNYKKKEKSLRNSRGINYSNNNNIIKENSWINHQSSVQESNPTIAAANNFQIYNTNNNDIINDLEIKLNQIHSNKEQNFNNLMGNYNYLKANNGINNINKDKIVKESNQFIIDIKKNNYGINPQRNSTKSTINISIGNYQKKTNNNINLNENEKLNAKTKENLNRLDKIRDQIGKLLK